MLIMLQIVQQGRVLGLPMAVASGGTRRHVIKWLTEASILDLFQAVVCGEDTKQGKPAPDPFLLVGVLPGMPY